MNEVILKVEHLSKTYKSKKRTTKAVDDISFYLKKGETLALVGESGCGKTTTGRIIVGLLKSDSGLVQFNNQQINNISKRAFRKLRSSIQIIFQDATAALNPRMSVRKLLLEAVRANGDTLADENKIVEELIKNVGLSINDLERYPHEFSGGQRQRISIARTLALNPEFIVCDEPISALDVSIQAQIINLLKNIQKELGIAYLFIAHDLSMVKHISDRIGVMYLGHLVEEGDSKELYANPMHPYTKALLSAVPIPDPLVGKSRKRIMLEGELPSPINPPSGCPFRTRCPYANEKCANEMPKMKEINGRKVACHMVG